MNNNLNNDPLVAIAILNWNDIRNTLLCIEKLKKQSYKNITIIVVDNGSNDFEGRKILYMHPEIILIESPENVGFTGGNNLAIRKSFELNPEYIWLFNNDAVPTEQTLEVLIKSIGRNDNVGLASPVIYNNDKAASIQAVVGIFDINAPSYKLTYRYSDYHEFINSKSIALVGTALLIKMNVFEKIGYLDESFFAYWEDVDFSIRSIKAGFKNLLIRDAAVFHPHKSILNDIHKIKPYYFYLMARNEIFLWKKNCSKFVYLRGVLWAVRANLQIILKMSGYTDGVYAIVDGMVDGILGRGGRYDENKKRSKFLRYLFFNHAKKILYVVERL